MVNVVKRGAGRPGHTARTNRHAQRTPLPPKPEVVADAREAIAETQKPYGEMTVTELRKAAVAAGVKGTSRMKRGEVMEAILVAEMAEVQKDLPKAAVVEPNKIDPQPQEKLQGNAAKPGETKSWAKAVSFRDAVAKLGWGTEVDYAPDGEDDDIVEVLASRGDEHLYISWVAGSLRHPVTYTIGDRTVKMRNASQAKQYAARPVDTAQREMTKVQLNKAFRRKAVEPKRTKLPFDISTATDEEVVTALLGKTVSWHNRLTQGTETGTFGEDAKRVQVIEADGGDRIVKFCCRATGYRAFRLSALTRVGGRGAHRVVVLPSKPKGK